MTEPARCRDCDVVLEQPYTVYYRVVGLSVMSAAMCDDCGNSANNRTRGWKKAGTIDARVRR